MGIKPSARVKNHRYILCFDGYSKIIAWWLDIKNQEQ
jgi:hypothetical protein